MISYNVHSSTTIELVNLTVELGYDKNAAVSLPQAAMSPLFLLLFLSSSCLALRLQGARPLQGDSGQALH